MAREVWRGDFVEGETTFGEYPALWKGDFLDFHLYCVVFGCCGGEIGVEGLSETIKAAGMRGGVKWCGGFGKVGKTQ